MYYEIRFSYDIDTVYNPDGDEVEVSYDDKEELIEKFTKYLKSRIEDFDLNDTDYDDEYLYIRFFSDTSLEDADLNSLVFKNGKYLMVSIRKEVFYGEEHDYDYYTEPFYDSTYVSVDMTISDPELTISEDYEIEESVEENSNRYRRVAYKQDAGNVTQGAAMFNAAMGEDLDTM